MSILLPNTLLSAQTDDKLHHFGISKSDPSLKETFSNVKFVCVGGSPTRMNRYAEMFAKENRDSPISANLSHSDRFSMWKTGYVLWVNHGMGVPSMSIMLVEVLKLLHYAGAIGVQFVRLGTSGGIGVAPGTVIVSAGVLNGLLEKKHIQVIGGRLVKRDAVLDKPLGDQLRETAVRLRIPVDGGLTLCTDDFYEGQMRLDGLFCEYTQEEKIAFMEELHKRGVKNIEMECTGFASYTHRAGVPAAVVCVTLLNRMVNDQVTLSKADYQDYELRPFRVVSEYIKERISMNGF